MIVSLLLPSTTPNRAPFAISPPLKHFSSNAPFLVLSPFFRPSTCMNKKLEGVLLNYFHVILFLCRSYTKQPPFLILKSLGLGVRYNLLGHGSNEYPPTVYVFIVYWYSI